MLLQVACPHSCSWSGSYKDYEGHLSTCPLHPVSCPHSPCTTVEVPSRLKSHIESCTFRPVTCQYCSKMMQYRVLESHETTDCERRPVSCSLCGEMVPFNSIGLHEQEECARAVRPCPFAEFGCDVRVSYRILCSTSLHNAYILQSQGIHSIRELKLRIL
jgi:hypothetical protein